MLKPLWTTFVDGLIDIDEKKSVPSSRQEWNYDTLFETKMFEIDTLFAGLGLTWNKMEWFADTALTPDEQNNRK